MEIMNFLESIPGEHKQMIERLIPIVEKHETGLTKGITKLMGKEILGYMQDGEIKYGFASFKNTLSFYAMPMYCYPEIHEKYKNNFKGNPFQRSCINIKKMDEFPYDEFGKFIIENSAYTFPKK